MAIFTAIFSSVSTTVISDCNQDLGSLMWQLSTTDVFLRELYGHVSCENLVRPPHIHLRSWESCWLKHRKMTNTWKECPIKTTKIIKSIGKLDYRCIYNNVKVNLNGSHFCKSCCLWLLIFSNKSKKSILTQHGDLYIKIVCCAHS